MNSKLTTPLTWLLGLAATYSAVNVMSNVSSTRIVDLGLVSVDAGTLLFPLTFTLRDLIHKVGNAQIARRVVVIAATLSALASVNFWIVGHLTPDMSVGPQEEFAQVLSITWRITVAGVVAQVISEFLDTEIYSLWVKKFGDRYIYGRVVSSNAVSVPTDSFVFSIIAFVGVLTPSAIVGVAIGNIVLKYVITMVFAPLIKLVPELPKLNTTKEDVSDSPNEGSLQETR